ncbi:MAG: NAD(P)/FAD-dependent oxidoreductase [Solirubrobacterales bacterium]
MTDLVVVGGGPAGLAAATAASDAGASTLLVDENDRLGGQYLRQPRGEAAASIADSSARGGAEAIAALDVSGAETSSSATAYGAGPGGIEIEQAGAHRTLASPLLVAAGATERVVPLPGWTLPGVVTCGAAQALVKMHGEPVGRRVLVAGSGPFLLPVGAALIRAGAEVAGVLEAQRLGRRAVAAACSSVDVIREAAGHLWALSAARVRLRTGWGVSSIRESAGGLRVEITRLDREGRPVGGTKESIECDAVCLSDGFVPSVELAELAGASVRFQALSRTWSVAADAETGSTAADGVWAAGACTEPWSGARLSAVAGRSAGRAAARELIGGPPAPFSDARGSELRLSRRLSLAFPTRPAWYERTTDDVIVCRCENVTAGAIREAARSAPDVNAVKRATRAGMGLCQGRTCQAAVAELTCAAGAVPIESVGRFTSRSPLRPTGLEVLAAGSASSR